MTKVVINKDFFVYLYYILLLAIYLSWSNFNAVPGPMVRLAYLGATIVPVLFWTRSWFAAVILLFSTLAQNSYSSSYLPSQDYTYLVVVIVALFFDRSRNKIKTPLCLYLILIIPCVINIFQSYTIERISFATLMVVLLVLSIDKNDDKQWSMISLCYMVICLVLSVSYLLYGRNFSMLYSAEFGEERVGFSDINYVASIIGFGVLAMLVSLIHEPRKNVFKTVFYVVVIIIALITIFSNASRGSLLALGVGVIVLLLFSKISIGSKLIISILIIGCLIILYNNNYMDLLLYRIENDNSTGGTGRVDIWKNKWSAYASSSVIKILFGYGYIGGRQLGQMNVMAFHNDFLAFLVEYGVVGLIIFMGFLATPIINSNKKNRPIVLASIAYLITVGLTLEPIAAGRLPFYGIWLYAYLASYQNAPVANNN